MRIALLSPYSWTYPGGVTRHIEALASELSAGGHQARILAPFDPDDIDTVQAAIECYAPGARVLAVDWHDWSGDPWSRGTWGMWRPGWASDGTLTALGARHGQIAYASSDYAPEWPGWIAGAVSAGQHAAQVLLDS